VHLETPASIQALGNSVGSLDLEMKGTDTIPTTASNSARDAFSITTVIRELSPVVHRVVCNENTKPRDR
jgi:hypothetical protein